MANNFHVPTSKALIDKVQLFWQFDRNNLAFNSEVIIPKGIIEIIFSFNQSNDFKAQIDTQTYKLPRCFINGYNTKPILLQLPVEQAFFGVTLFPTAIKNIIGVPASEFANQCVDMTLVDPSFNSLWNHLAEQKTFYERVISFSVWLEKKGSNITQQEQGFNQFLTGWSSALITTSQVADQLCYSPRHLSRKVSEITSMNLEQTILYKKYVRAIHLMHHSEQSLTEIAYSCQFYDQSHFIKTFKSFTHLTPGEYKNLKSPVIGHIYENVR